MMAACRFDTPLGPVWATTERGLLTSLNFESESLLARLTGDADHLDDDPVLTSTRRQIGEYFAGRRRDFTLPLGPSGTSFQREVWQCLTGIPFGHTTTYGALARALNRPNATRAVGAANGRNPLAIVVPCHRVIGADGTLTGYAGGLARKQALLALERGQAPWTGQVPG